MKAWIGALLIGLGGTVCAHAQLAFPVSSATETSPSTMAQPGGARFLGQSQSSPAPSHVGPLFQSGPTPAPVVSLQSPIRLGSVPPAPVFPTLQPPTQTTEHLLPPPKVIPPVMLPVPGLDEPAMPIGGVVTESFGAFPMEFPAIGPWGAGIESGDAKPYYWFGADYLYWWLKKGPMPQPLVVTGSPTDALPGALGQPGTILLYGGKDIDYHPFSGARINMGLWFGAEHRFGFEMGGFILEQKATKFTGTGGSTGTPFLARPFIDAQTSTENVYFISQNFTDPARSAAMTGRIEVSNSSRMWSWEINGLWNVCRGSMATANLIGGFRSVGLRERFGVTEVLRNLQPGGGVSFEGASVDPLSTVTTFDKFDAENTFYGPQFGVRALLQYGRFSINLSGKAAVGVVQQLVVVDGGSIVRNAGSIVTGASPGGVLAQGTNIGRHFKNSFAWAPEFAGDICFDITDRLAVKLGYTFVALSNVARPGDQIDRTINPGQVPSDFNFGTNGPARPVFPYKTSSVWTQGANLGLEFRY